MWPVLSDPEAITRACLDVMREAEAVVVTTLDERGSPCSRAMFNLRRETQFPTLREIFRSGDDRLLVYLSTNTSSEKVKHIGRDPRVSLYYCLPGRTTGVMLAGQVRVVDERAVKRAVWQPGWEIYFPAGPTDADYTILRLHPTRVRGWLSECGFDHHIEANQ